MDFLRVQCWVSEKKKSLQEEWEKILGDELRPVVEKCFKSRCLTWKQKTATSESGSFSVSHRTLYFVY